MKYRRVVALQHIIGIPDGDGGQTSLEGGETGRIPEAVAVKWAELPDPPIVLLEDDEDPNEEEL